MPAVFLAASFVTITANGARFMENFREGTPPVVRDSDLWPWAWLHRHPHLFVHGLAFSLTLLGILLVHEFGHYIACRVHGIRCTLPWVIPAPTLSGTAGAVIRIRSRIPTMDALMDVGIYGPLAGYIASTIAIAVGFLLSTPRAAGAPEALVAFGGDPLTLRLVHRVLALANPSLPSFNALSPHPVLVAGWIGLFITALNLIPGGQLDGGHILYALSPRWHRVSTNLLPVVLFAAGAFYWAGWILWGVFLLIPFMRHPKVVAPMPLSSGRLLLGAIGAVLFLLTVTATPFYDSSLIELFR